MLCGLHGGFAATLLAAGATGSSLALNPVGVTFCGWIGDSISTAQYSNAPAQYASATRIVQNWSVGGTTWTGGQIPSEYTSNVYNQTTLICEGGVNDIRNGVLATALLNLVLPFIDARLAEGKRVVLNNIAPWKGTAGWTAGQQAETDAYNAALVPTLRPGLIVVDLFSLWEDPANPDTLLPAYDSGDHLHPNSTGGAVWAAVIAAVAP